MARPKLLVLRAPGINCERESYHAFELAGGEPSYVHIKRPWLHRLGKRLERAGKRLRTSQEYLSEDP